MNNTILPRLDELIAHHEKWGSNDFTFSQWILWIAILASFTATIMVVLDKLPKWSLAIIAGLPALMLMVDKTFRFRDRAQWHEFYALHVSEIRDDLQFADLPEGDAVRKLAKLRADMHGKWPGENISNIPTAPSESTVLPTNK